MTHCSTRLSLLTLGVLFLALPGLPSSAAAQSTLNVEDEGTQDEVVVSAQGVSTDADQDRDARFQQNRQVLEGVQVDFFRLSRASEDGKDFFQLLVRDAAQEDQRLELRSGLNNTVKLDVDWIKLPYRYGDGARFVLGTQNPDVFRIADFIQEGHENPTGDGVPFYSKPNALPDNDIVGILMNQVLEGSDPFSIGTRREVGRAALELTPGPNWDVRVSAAREWRDGQRGTGSGTYQRITDVNGDGQTDYDYFFAVRGLELPATVEYRTTTLNTSASYTREKWFASAGLDYLAFENSFIGTTYDNPFWFTDTLASSGSLRGLWEQGRMSLPPSNDSWSVNLSGGIIFSRRTQLTALFSRGRLTQDDPFLPVTTNTSLIGSADVNGDGRVDGADDPTTVATLPRRSLDAKINTTVVGATFTTRPSDRVAFNARFHLYDYDSDYDAFVMPFRAEYVESQLKPDFHKGDLLHVPVDFRRTRAKADLTLKASDQLRLRLFGERVDFDRDQYADLDGVAPFDRDAGFRAVKSTSDNRVGATLILTGGADFGGRVTYRYSDRDFDGTYQVAFDGELEGVRQFDLAKRTRNAVDATVDLLASRPANLSLTYRYSEDDYPDTEYGRQAGKTQGFTVNLNYAANERVTVFVWGEWSRNEINGHLRTKCSNCTPPPGVTWTTPWEVPNFDWSSEYTDTTTALGGGFDFSTEDKRWSAELRGHWVKGNVEQLTRNPGPPVDLINPGNPIAQVALGFDFPDQENELLLAELRLTRRLNERVSFGIWYWFEKLNLDDFMWDSLDPYGRNFLEVDDGTRWMFLDSRYGGYTANVFQAFVKARF